MKNTILEISRQNQIGKLTPWFSQTLEELIEQELFCSNHTMSSWA